MKKLCAAILTVSLVLTSGTVAFAKPKEQPKQGKPNVTVSESKGKKVNVNKKDLEKAKTQLVQKVNVQIEQLKKLKSYIVSSDGKFLIELKDTATANAAIKSIDDALLALNDLKNKILAATDSKTLKELGKTLEKSWLKNQFFMKRVIGLTSAARFKKALDQTQTLVDKLANGIAELNSTNTTLNPDELKKGLDAIKAKLESAKKNYLDALNLFVTLNYNDKSEKSYKAAEEKLKKASKELHDALKQTKKLLNLIKGTDEDEDEDEDDNTADITKPTVIAATWFGFGSLEAKLVISFSEEMDTTKLTKANFLKNVNGTGFTAITTEDAIAVAADGKSVTLTLKNTTAINTLAIGVTGAADKAGNGFEGNAAYSGTNFTLTQDSVSVAKVEAIAKNMIKVTFSGKLISVSTVGFSLWEKTTGVDTGITLNMASPLVTIDDKSEVTFVLSADLTETAQRNTHTLQLVINGAIGTRNELGTQLSNAAYIAEATASRDVSDKIAPTITSVVRISETTLLLTFNETIKASTITTGVNGFSVTGGTATLTAVAIPGNVDANTLILTGTGFDAATTKLNYSSSGNISDVLGNKLLGFTDKAVTNP